MEERARGKGLRAEVNSRGKERQQERKEGWQEVRIGGKGREGWDDGKEGWVDGRKEGQKEGRLKTG